MYQILHYLNGTLGKGLLFKKQMELSLEVYTDVDHAGLIMDRRSTSYCTFFGGNLMTWRNKKQPVVDSKCKSRIYNDTQDL